ncbi:hypothetical protein [Methylobacterium sp. ID0610]|uniref:hypothetical protein n=1 Tax=Methylobacterium carpenticola TaxID=3344827 RepID=UPI003673839C
MKAHLAGLVAAVLVLVPGAASAQWYEHGPRHHHHHHWSHHHHGHGYGHGYERRDRHGYDRPGRFERDHHHHHFGH